MLIEITRNICTPNPTVEIGSLYVNPANIMTMECNTGIKQRDIMGESYFLELHLHLNNQDYLLFRQPISKENIHNSSIIEEMLEDTVSQLEQLKEVLEKL